MVTLKCLMAIYAISNPGQVGNESDTVLLHFSAEWCGPCKMVEPTVNRLESDGYPIRHVDFDAERQLASRFNVQSVPCFILVSNGKIVDRVEGAASYARLARMYQTAGYARGSLAARSNTSAQIASPQVARPSNSNQYVRQAPSGAGRLAAVASRHQYSGQSQPTNRNHVQPRQDFAVAPNNVIPVSHITDAASNNLAQRRPQVAPSVAALQSTVRLIVQDADGKSVGTGTVIDVHQNEALVITCAHIFRPTQGRGPIQVDFFCDGARGPVSGELICFDLKKDIALVSVRPNCVVSPIPVAGQDMQIVERQRVFSVGCDKGNSPSVRNSYITGVNQIVGSPKIEVAGMPVQGRSGGGLFSEDGKLIGICNLASPQDNEGIYAALSVIHAQLDLIGQQRLYKRSVPTDSQLVNNSPATTIQSVTTSNPTAIRPIVGAGVSVAGQTRNNENAAAVPVAHGAQDTTEVICVIRTAADPQGQSRVVILKQPSKELIEKIAEESRNAMPTANAQRY